MKQLTKAERKDIYLKVAEHFFLTNDYWVCSVLLKYGKCMASDVPKVFPEFGIFEPTESEKEGFMSWWQGDHALQSRIDSLLLSAAMC